MTQQELDEETQMLKRTAQHMFGSNVELTPVVIENIREIYRLRMATTAFNTSGAAITGDHTAGSAA